MKTILFFAVGILLISGFACSQDYIFVSQVPLGFQNNDFVRVYEKHIKKKGFYNGVYLYSLGEKQYYWGNFSVSAESRKLKKYDIYVITSIIIKFHDLDKYYAGEFYEILLEKLNSQFGKCRVEGTLRLVYIWENEDVLIRKEDNCITFYAKERYLENLQREILKNSVEALFSRR
ncbi:MAG: hypothetical protein PHO00_02050 [bacterium]|nr:hypothetical protein [bacterium]